MPFVQLLYRASSVPDEGLVRLRDAIRTTIARELTRADPEHEVTSAMVDATLRSIGPLDHVQPAMVITVLARYETARAASAHVIVSHVEREALDAGAPEGTMVELVLNNRWSKYEYPHP